MPQPTRSFYRPAFPLSVDRDWIDFQHLPSEIPERIAEETSRCLEKTVGSDG
jgi:hypothetical protein